MNNYNTDYHQESSTIVFMIYFKKEEESYYIRDYKYTNLALGIPSILIRIDKNFVSIYNEIGSTSNLKNNLFLVIAGI